MYKIILLIAFGSFAIAANAQKLNDADVNPNIKASLKKLHPNAVVNEWEKEGNNYEAEFTENGIETSVELGPNGQLISTETEMKVADLPKSVSDYCSKNMPGKKIKEASKIIAANGKVSYEAEVGGTDYIFDADGNFLSKEVEKDDDKDDDKK